MREIKFRGQTYDTPPHWVFGDLYHYTTGEPAINYTHPHKKWLESEPVRPETVGQFTGLKDCKGQEIFEGDVVRTDDWSTPSYIRWDDTTASFVVDRWSVNLAHVSQIKVIGNVHDNPELLEATE